MTWWCGKLFEKLRTQFCYVALFWRISWVLKKVGYYQTNIFWYSYEITKNYEISIFCHRVFFYCYADVAKHFSRTMGPSSWIINIIKSTWIGSIIIQSFRKHPRVSIKDFRNIFYDHCCTCIILIIILLDLFLSNILVWISPKSSYSYFFFLFFFYVVRK